MASINLRLDERTKKDGMCPIRMRVSINRTSAYINTGVSVEPKYFNCSDLRKPILKAAYMSSFKNEQIAALIRKYDEALFDIERDPKLSIDTMTASELRAYIIDDKEHAPKRVAKACAHGRVDFLAWFDQFGHDAYLAPSDKRKADKTIRGYEYVWRLLNEYCKHKGTDRIYFDELGYALLIDIRKYLEDTGRGTSVLVQVEACMHAAWRQAKRMRMINDPFDPWDGYTKTRPQEPENIDFAPIDEVRSMLHYDTDGMSGSEWFDKARDLIRISWMLCGCNLKDIYYMPEPINGEFVFVRHKLQKKNKHIRRRPLHIRIEPEMQLMLDKYKGDGKAFCFADDVKNYETFSRKVADRLERLGKLSGTDVDFRRLRRSWGTYAVRLTRDKFIVDMSMGHIPEGMLDKHYNAHDWDETSRCNRIMIDFLLG